jgi:hypothetical protein
MKRCAKCIMSETLPGITFNSEGVCSLCQDYQKERYFGKEKLDQIVAEAKKRGGKYDCIVPMSGGRDSTFVLYVARAIYDLKVLAVNYDNEFRNPQALVNIETACKKLNADFVSIRSKGDLAQKIVRHGVKSQGLRRKYGLCRACTYGFTSAAYRAAIQHGTPLIFWGDSQQERTNPIENKVSKFLKHKRGTFSKLLNLDYYQYEYRFLRQRLQFHVPGNSIFSRHPKLKDKNISEIHVFYYIPWDRKQIKETIMNELGWRKPSGSVSTWRTDCQLTPLVNYCFYKMFDCGKETFGYCQMINSGQMGREEALEQEAKMREIMAEKTFFKKQLVDTIGLSEKDAERIAST